MASKQAKKNPSANRISSATPREAASVAASSGGLHDSKRTRVVIWPEWNDVDVNAEKWDAAHKGKEKEKGKSPTAQHFFEDPEGRIDMPSSLKVDHWKRPQDFITDKTPVVVDPDGMRDFDLISPNEHIHNSELMRCIISQITMLWEMSAHPNGCGDSSAESPFDETGHSWRPWEHIYSLCKVGKGPHVPLYNPHGKYVVKLYWMGCWRKITVDDAIPFDDDNMMMLPATSMQQELWPMLLTKALIKVASLDYNGGSTSSEFGDCSILHCLKSWLPEAVPLQNSKLSSVWEYLKCAIPEWTLPEQDTVKALDGNGDQPRREGQSAQYGDSREDKSDKDLPIRDAKGEKPDAKQKEKAKDPKGKDAKDDKGKKDKDKEKKDHRDKNEEYSFPDKPEVVVFASYWGMAKHPAKISTLTDVANASEQLRQLGLSHLFPHAVSITQTRSCPLEPPPPPEVIPAWKLIRPRKKKVLPTDEPQPEPEDPKPIQCLELTSPFVNYKVSPIPIPTDTNRPKSALERGTTRSRTSTPRIEEDMEECGEGVPQQVSSPKVERRSAKGVSPSIGSSSVKREEKREAAISQQTTTSTKEMVTTEGRASATEILVTDTVDQSMPDGKMEAQQPDSSDERPKKFWIDFDVFCKCFQTLYIIHKPHTYCCNHRLTDLKNNAPPTTATGAKGDKKSTPTASGGSAEDKQPHYLFVDNLEPTEIVVSFSSLSRWHEGGPPLMSTLIDEKKSLSSLKGTQKERELEKDLTVITSSSMLEEDVHLQTKRRPFLKIYYLNEWLGYRASHSSRKLSKIYFSGSANGHFSRPVLTPFLAGSTEREVVTAPPIQPGSLVAEPYTWKSLVAGQPVMRLRTTGTKTSVLTLPAGRHVLKFLMTAPLGYHVQLCSTTKFEFGEEDTVMAELVKESCRFVETATQVLTSLGKAVNAFIEPAAFPQVFDELITMHCPYRNDKRISNYHHFEVFNKSLYNTVGKILGPENINPDMVFAWRAFNFDVTTKNMFGSSASSRPATSTTSHRGSAKHTGSKKQAASTESADTEKVDIGWTNREPTPEEHVAVVKLQRLWRGCWVRKIKSARMPGTEINAKCSENLQKCWALLSASDQQIKDSGLALFRCMFKIDPELMPRYSFYADEWSKIYYDDYQGNFADQPPNSWFVVFREIFYVTEEVLAVPKVYVPISTCLLRVINNDTGEEIPQVFQKVAPYVYKRNKKGYTFVADARSVDHPVMAGRWRLRLIGSLGPLPAPLGQEMNSAFNPKEIRDYYLPNNKNIMLRYSVRVTEDHLVSMQLNTSKQDVYIKLSVLDHEEEVISTMGKGHVVLPAVIFQKDPGSDDSKHEDKSEPDKRASSRSSNKGKPVVASTSQSNMGGGKGKRPDSISNEGRASMSSHHSDLTGSASDLEEKELKPHKYIVQATVLRNSWPLSESSWAFVHILKEAEKNELKVAFKDRASSPSRTAAPATGGGAGGGKPAKAAKGGKDKGSKEKEQKSSRPSSQQFDLAKPHWALRIVSDSSSVEDIDIRRDTERADEIRAMKKAWEDAEPGRAAKAQQSRLKYLNTHMIKVHPDKDDGDEGGDDTGDVSADDHDMAPPQSPTSMLDQAETDGILTQDPPRPVTPKEILQPLDITPFIRRGGSPQFMNDAMIAEQRKLKEKEIAEFSAFRERVEKWREQDRQNRNLAKQRQLEECEQLQAMLDAARDAVNKPREAIRQKYLDTERQRQEALAAMEMSQRSEIDTKSPKGKKGSAKKSPTGKKKK